ncbi:O-methyltransferase, putative [Talaromyces stipitatus ATCC 10500]|uniref:O-methyltransferase, putative n=1 Tax=Talaromyces stipitatus (strain ATCC 10500 / CBS 375.48 / QM 6759 / NRRL 1006) TaxID=441959 RepID=B8MPS5_TALSN|nr:O-methyltransferase, putative [Talaromyces stipitatus ATCC 10500]EED12733.1 O-methyltransferase, putative [Talaromyces stipitatus ATCC 10500]
MRTIQDAYQMLQLLELTQKSIHQIIGEWATEYSTEPSRASKLGTEKKDSSLPSRELYEARRTLLAVTGKLVELVADPSERLLEVSSSYNEARCLHIAASLRIADIIHAGGEAGASIETLSKQTGVEAAKLGRIMRCLCSNHVFTEIKDNWFANNHISQALVDNEPLRAYIVMFSFDLYTASDSLPRTLMHSDFANSYSVSETSFQKALGISKERWNWLEEEISPTDVQNGGPGKYPGCFGPEYSSAIAQIHSNHTIKRPEHEIFGLAMLGGGKITGVAHLYDFPWSSLGKATVVDVGGGVGGFCLQLSHIYPELNFVVLDRAPVLQQAQNTVWPKENQSALDEGRVKFIPHSFFEENPIKGADVYWLRYILYIQSLPLNPSITQCGCNTDMNYQNIQA